MNITSGKLKLTIAAVYLSLLFIGLYFLFSVVDLKDLTSYDFVRSNKDTILQYKEENFLFKSPICKTSSVLPSICFPFKSTVAIILSILFRDVFIYLPTFIISLREIYITRVRIISELNPELRVIEVNLSGKIKTALQMVAIFTLFISFHPSSYSLLLENLGKIILWIALVQTIISLANYLLERRR